MSNETRPAAVGARIEPGVGPLAQRVESLLQELAEHDPLLKLAMDRRCELKQNCERGPFGCDCGRAIR